jgi:Flp pilus assembly protein TadG
MSNDKKPEGAVSIIFSILLLILFGFAALAVDLGYMAVAKSELQNSADAGARAGALRMYVNGSGPNWAGAQQRAEELAELNPSTGNPVVLLSPPEVGYWNLDTRGQTIQSPTGFTPTAKDLPAVKVTASRTGAGDGGPISTLFARTLEIDTAPVSATAIAVVSGPGYVDQRNLFPFAMSQCMYDTYWDASATPPGPTLENGAPKRFTLGTDIKDDVCGHNTGTWTTLKWLESESAEVIREIIEGYGTSNPFLPSELVTISEIINLAPGVKTTNYQAVDTCVGSTRRCREVTVPVVESILVDEAPVLAFACLNFLSVNYRGKDKTITVEMTRNCDPPDSGGIGPDYGFKPRPRIVQ